jgi:hypothetical protein
VNIEVLPIQLPSAALCPLVLEANALVESLGVNVFRVNSELDSCKAALGGLGQSGLNELPSNALSAEASGDCHAQYTCVRPHLPNEWQHIAPTYHLCLSDSNKVDVARAHDALVVGERLLSRPSLSEGQEAPLSADGVKQDMKPLEVAFLQRFEVNGHGFRDA